MEDFKDSDLYVDLLWTVSPIYNAYNKLVNKLSEKGPLVMEFNVKNHLPRIFLQKVTVRNKEEDRIDEMEEWGNPVVDSLEEINEIKQIEAYLLSDDVGKKDIDPIIRYFKQKEEEPLTFWDKREVIAGNKDVTPDGLAGPATAVFNLAYALTIQDAIVFVDPNTELDEKVIAALFIIPMPTKFGKVFLKPADDLGGAGKVRGKGKTGGDSLGTRGKYQVGAYKDIKEGGGLDAHHAGQKAVMKKLVDNYDLNTAPAINVPKIGHTIKGPNGIVSRSTKGIDNPRQLLARDIRELRRVYDDIPNSALKELIEINKKMYPEMRK